MALFSAGKRSDHRNSISGITKAAVKNCPISVGQLSVSTKSTTLSKDKRNRCDKILLCVFPPIPPFRRKSAPQATLPLLTADFLFKESLRRHMSACVT